MARPTLRHDAREAGIQWYLEGMRLPPPQDGFENIATAAAADNPSSRFVLPSPSSPASPRIERSRTRARIHFGFFTSIPLLVLVFGIGMKILIFHRDGFFFEFPLRGLVSEKNTPTVTSQIPLFLGGYLSKIVGVCGVRKMEWRMDFFC